MADNESQHTERETATDVTSAAAQSGAVVPFKDRSAGLMVFGIVQILMGIGCTMMIPLMLLGARTGGAASLRMMIPAAGFYAILAVALVWLGIGSILARRWARAVTLILAWTWLVIGVVSFITVVPMTLGIINQANPDRPLPLGAVGMIEAIMVGMLGFIYVILPGVFVLFYRSPHVKATCESADPHIRWTDRCPLPVVALSVMLGFGAVSSLTTLSYGGVIPLFGTLVTGVPAAVFVLLMAMLFGYLAWATYKLKMSAWWITMITCAVFLLSGVITFARIDMMDLYRAMDLPDQQLKQIQQSGIVDRMNMPAMMGTWFVVTVGYLLWVRLYFVAARNSQTQP